MNKMQTHFTTEEIRNSEDYKQIKETLIGEIITYHHKMYNILERMENLSKIHELLLDINDRLTMIEYCLKNKGFLEQEVNQK